MTWTRRAFEAVRDAEYYGSPVYNRDYILHWLMHRLARSAS